MRRLQQGSAAGGMGSMGVLRSSNVARLVTHKGHLRRFDSGDRDLPKYSESRHSLGTFGAKPFVSLLARRGLPAKAPAGQPPQTSRPAVTVGNQLVGPRAHPKLHSILPIRATPETWRPRSCSSEGLHGTKLNLRPSSIMAKRLEARSRRRR
jgi:hypothetical protein